MAGAPGREGGASARRHRAWRRGGRKERGDVRGRPPAPRSPSPAFPFSKPDPGHLRATARGGRRGGASPGRAQAPPAGASRGVGAASLHCGKEGCSQPLVNADLLVTLGPRNTFTLPLPEHCWGIPLRRGRKTTLPSYFPHGEAATPTHSGLFAKPEAVQSAHRAFFWLSFQVLSSRLCALGQVTFPFSLPIYVIKL